MQDITRFYHGISIHAPHEGERRHTLTTHSTGKNSFQSTLPTRGSDVWGENNVIVDGHDFNPRSPRGGATVAKDGRGLAAIFQSTLPTRGSDFGAVRCSGITGISIHAPHEGERPAACCSTRIVPALFQSTLPTRGSDTARELSLLCDR